MQRSATITATATRSTRFNASRTPTSRSSVSRMNRALAAKNSRHDATAPERAFRTSRPPSRKSKRKADNTVKVLFRRLAFANQLQVVDALPDCRSQLVRIDQACEVGASAQTALRDPQHVLVLAEEHAA